MTARLIIHQFDPFTPQPGGVDTCISDLIAYAPHETQFAVVGATARRNLALGKWYEINHRERDVLFMPVARLWQGTSRRIPHSAHVAAGLVRWRRRLPRVPVQTHRLDLAAATYAIGRLHPAYIQFIHNPHGRYEGVVGHGSDSFWRFAPWLYHAIEPRLLRRADRVIVFSRAEAERLRDANVDATAWQAWFDPDTFYPPTSAAQQTGVLQIAWIGRLERQKDPLLALDVLAALLRRAIPLHATFLGEGSMRRALERRAGDLELTEAVSFVGPGSREDVAALLRKSQVLLLTSHYEGSPRILIEALATATPVAVTREADPDSLIASERTGSVSTSREADAVADAVLEALDARHDVCVSAVEHLRADVAVPRLIRETEVMR